MALQDPEQEKLLQPKKKKAKYGNTKVELDGITFDSIAEAARYVQLKEGGAESLQIKPVYRFKCGVKYIPDFRYEKFIHGKWSIVLEDVKGFVVPIFSVKRKMLFSEFGIDVNVIQISSEMAHLLVKGYIGRSIKSDRMRK